MPFALIIWAIIIFIIAASCPGFFTCLLLCGVVVGGPALAIYIYKDKKWRKEMNKVIDDCMKDGWK
ncbi:MAG: hypothetical protein NC039_01935 [Muribaculaceae bacterium]|nr:hypothetical protein [Muribaculaceae bacterium]